MIDPNRQTPHQPPPLPPMARFARPPLPSQPGRVVLLFFLGLGLGVAVSILVWIFGWERFSFEGSTVAIILVPSLKLAAGLGLVFTPRWRSLGAGILVSIALGVLIFGGVMIGSIANYARSSSSPTTAPSTQGVSQPVTCKSLH